MTKPNFLVFMTDHQRGDMQPPFGKVRTPHIDKLFQNGVSFTHAYCPAPHCCPSRATFFSGLYPSEHGVWNNVDVSNTLSRGLYDHVRLFSDDLKEAGYRLYYSGKWHVSSLEGPENRGFENIYPGAGTYGPQRNEPDTRAWRVYQQGRKPKPAHEARREAEIIRLGYPAYSQYGVHADFYNDRPKVEAAIQQIENLDRDEPFFMYVGTLGPHDPYFVPQTYLDWYDSNDISLPESFADDMNDKPALYRRTRDRYAQLTTQEHLESIRHYYAFCSYEDALFGELLTALENKGLLANTIVMYTSDHGDYAGAHRLWAKGLPCFHEAYHINSVIGYGGIQARRKCVDSFISLADYAPTILELAGIRVDRRFAGQSFAACLDHREQTHPTLHDAMYTQTNGNEVYGIQRSVFNKDYKYVFNTFDYDELYDLRNDPHECTNRINDPAYKQIVQEMCEKMWRFAYDNKDNIVNPYIMTALAPYGPGILF